MKKVARSVIAAGILSAKSTQFMSSKVKIYTKTGDSGQTSLYGGKRVFKNNQRVVAYGSLDELNTILGMVISKLFDQEVRKYLISIQEDLFLIGSNLAGSTRQDLKSLEGRVSDMEKFIDKLDKNLDELKNFILPGGGEKGSLLHFGRSVARRAEREIVKLSESEAVDKVILVYLNRLSDLLFVIARYINNKEKRTEIIWKGS